MQKLLSQLLPSFSHQAVAADGVTAVQESDIGHISIKNLVFDSREPSEKNLSRRQLKGEPL